MSQSTAEMHIKRHEACKSARLNFESYWQDLHDYFDPEGNDVNTSYHPGTELTQNQLFDSNSLETADILASGLMNYLTPPASKWFALRTKDPLRMESKPVMHYLKDVEAEVTHTLNNSNYYDTKPDFYKKSGVYGTSILFEEEDATDDIRFWSLPVKQVCMIEDAAGRVNEYYINFDYTDLQAVTRFGEKSVNPEVLKRAKDNVNPNATMSYTLYIGPRHNRDPRKEDKNNMAFQSLWIDVKHKTIIEEGGYRELPAMAHRFYKRSGIVWGFSPAMKALPDVRVLNAMAKTQLRAAMKQSDPPIAMPENAFMIPFNFNPRGTNYYNKNAMKKDDIFPVGNYGNIGVAMEMMDYRVQRIRGQMFTDVFLAFQNITKTMTVPEVMEKVTERMTLLGPAVGRYISAINDPVIDRTIKTLDRRGKLPEPPPELLEDPRYEIDYMSQLATAQRSGELTSLQTALTMVGNMAQFNPAVLDKINADKGVDVVFGITGAPVQMLRDDAEVDAIRDARAETEAQAQQMAMLEQGAAIAKDATAASATARESVTV